MKIQIGTPVGRGECTTAYAESVFALLKAVQTTRPEIDLPLPLFPQASLIASLRNVLASRLLADASCTHLLFIDSDMGFQPSAVLRMIDLDKDVVGAIYPARVASNPHRFIGGDAIIRDAAGSFSLANGFVRSASVGMGLTLIKRGAIERMAEVYPDLFAGAGRYASAGIARMFHCFESIRAEDGQYLSEDLSFCRRWTDIGGEIWAQVDEVITHVGTAYYRGRFIDQLRPAEPRAPATGVDPPPAAS